MKKIFMSLATAVLLFSACSSDENQNTDPQATTLGSLNFEVKLEEASQKAASTNNIIPITTWNNIKEVQVFLYKKGTGAVDGEIVYSYVIDQAKLTAQTDKKFIWKDIPVGTYDLALVANIGAPAKMGMSVDGGTTATDFNGSNVRSKKVNTDVRMSLRPGTFPAGHTFDAANKAYAGPNEIFTAYKQDVVITEGVTNTLATALGLKRDVSMMRVRIDKSKPELNGATGVDFASADNSIVIHRMPTAFGLKTQTPAFGGGIFGASNVNHIMVAATGANTFLSANPTSGYKNTATPADLNIINRPGENFSLWRDIVVLPNIVKNTDGTVPNVANADNDRKYFIVISGKGKTGYVALDENNNEKTLTQPTNVYWYGVINGSFSPNKIREVNLQITSPGKIVNPIGPQKEGGLEITIGSPEDWNSAVEADNMEI